MAAETQHPIEVGPPIELRPSDPDPRVLAVAGELDTQLLDGSLTGDQAFGAFAERFVVHIPFGDYVKNGNHSAAA